MTDFLYPFIEREEEDLDALLADLTESVRQKTRINADLRSTTLTDLDRSLHAAARAMADRFIDGGRLFTFGNGGSSTDAATLAALFATPPSGRPLPARCLVDDTAVITALANDVGFSLVFSRQVMAFARPGDVVLGFSTSGNSNNLLSAFDAARGTGALRIGLAGYDGGDMGRARLDHCLVVGSDSVHRIQETEAALGFALWQAVQVELEGRAAHA